MNERLILIVDDEPDICGELSIFLSNSGYQTIIANNGEMALKLFRAHSPILVISDLKMPVMNGLELLKRLRTISKETRVILISGAADRQDIITAMKSEAFDFLLKPVNLKDLLRVVEKAVVRTRDEMRMHEVWNRNKMIEFHLAPDSDQYSILYLNQDMDQHTAYKYMKELQSLLNGEIRSKEVIMFMKNVDYINSAGLKLLLDMRDEIERSGKKLHLCALSDSVFLYLNSLGYTSQFDIWKNIEELVQNM